jgi:hypothetical protein
MGTEMKVETLKMDPEIARELWRKYQTHRAYQAPHDAEIAAIYKRIAQGKTVIRALESIKSAGVDEKGLPRLAIARADQALCYWHADGSTRSFSGQRWGIWKHKSLRSPTIRINWPDAPRQRDVCEAVVPIIPVHLRPKRGLANYHILWEAEWTKRYPVDPYLLRRFGGDAWLVVAAWDLTDVERAVMSSRLNS